MTSFHQHEVTVMRNKKPVMAPQVINAESEAGLGYIMGVIIHTLPSITLNKQLTFKIKPNLKSANQFVYGLRLGYADPTVPRNFYGMINITPEQIKEHATAMAKGREAYMHLHGPTSHVANNWSSQQHALGSSAMTLANQLKDQNVADGVRIAALQQKANRLSDDLARQANLSSTMRLATKHRNN